MKPRESVSLLIRNCYGNYLMGRRGIKQSFPLFLQPPGGGIKKGESPKAAAIRECHEETGVKLKASSLAWIGNVAFATPGDTPFRIQGFLCQYAGDFGAFHDRENKGVVWRWIAPSDMMRPMLRCVLPLVELAEEYVQKKRK